MRIAQLFQDIETGCLTVVKEAARAYDDHVRGLTARQEFYIYPNGLIVSMTTVDGGYTVQPLHGDDEAIFMNRYPQYF